MQRYFREQEQCRKFFGQRGRGGGGGEVSVNGSEDKYTQESNNDTENDSQEIESSSPETSTTIHS